MKKILFIIAIVMPLSLISQTDVDALRYSNTSYIGTSRMSGLSGAMGALGADFGALSINPAGIATFKKSEFSFSSGLHIDQTKSSFFDQKNTDSKFSMYISNIGMVFTNNYAGQSKDKQASGWKSVSYAFGMNRLADYNINQYYSGSNLQNSMIDRWLEEANQGSGVAPNNITKRYEYGAGLAYQTYLLDPIPSDTMHYTGKINNGGVKQSRSISSKGSYDEYTFSIGGNYNNKIQVGLTVGMPKIKYRENVVYREIDIADSIQNFKSFTLSDNLSTTGTGVNLKAGFIWRFTPYIRFGAAIHSPTILSMRDDYSTTLSSDVESLGSFEYSSPSGYYQYKLITPFRAVFSGVFLFKDKGFITADYEYVNYYNAFFSMSSADKAFENDLNNSIRSKYGPSSILRVGGEIRKDIFQIRAGLRFASSPFQYGVASGQADQSQSGFSLGAGVHGKYYFIDVAFVNNSFTSFDVPYLLKDPAESVGGAVLNNSISNYQFTLGLRF